MMWVLIIIGVVAFFIWIDREVEKSDKKYKEKLKKQGKEYLDYYYDLEYMGGFKDIGKGKASMRLLNTELEIIFKDKNYMKRIIKKEDINDIYVNSEEEIRHKIGVGKLVAFGVFALAMDNNKEKINNYIVIDCNYEGDNLVIVFNDGETGDGAVAYMRKVYLNK